MNVLSEEERKKRKHLRDKKYRDNLSAERKREMYDKKKLYDKINRDKINLQKKEWYHKMNPEQRKKALEYRRNYNRKNKEKIKEWNKICQKKYYAKNKDIICSKLRARRSNDPLFKLSSLYRNRIRKFLIKIGKVNRKNDLLGCDWLFLKKHLEKQFIEGMSWENHGKWHIDHIKPLSLAKNMEDMKKLCHYTNLQPLWATDNIKKGNKIT